MAAYDDIITAWAQVAAPSVPPVEKVEIDRSNSALLILDVQKNNCTAEVRPRCLARAPIIASLIARAREMGVTVVYSLTRKGTPESILEAVAPQRGEEIVQASVDKFQGTELENILRSKRARSLILTGTAAHGAVLHTATGAALRGFEVVVPVDTISSTETYAEQYTCWHLLHAPGTRGVVRLTRAAWIDFTEPEGN